MSDIRPGAADEHFHRFLEESDELAGEVEARSVALERDPSDFENVHAIFRAVHSLKGNSAFFDLGHVRSFCHSFENFLDIVREKRIGITREVAGFILEGADHLKSIFSRLRASGGDVELGPGETDYLDRMEGMAGSAGDVIERLRPELLRFFAKAREEGLLEEETPLGELYSLIGKTAPQLAHERRRADDGARVKKMIGAVDVTHEYMSLVKLLEDAKSGERMENAFTVFMSAVEGLIEKSARAGAEEAAGILREMRDNFEIFYQDDIGIDEMLADSIAGPLGEYGRLLTDERPVSEAAPLEGLKDDGLDRAQALKAKTVRVNEAVLDDFIDRVGELVTIRELLILLQRRLEDGDTDGLALDFKTTNQAFGELSARLQKNLYEIRKAPVERAMSKLPRLARSISKSSGKSIRVETRGGEAEVDKSMLEKIETILAHLVRNSADHGIEAPEERKKAGKDAQGTISIGVEAAKNGMLITVSDDGRGVDVDRVLKRAVERGLAAADAAARMGEAEALDFLTRPGFSTAEKVTETSGRGVGLDVLVSSVKDMNGSVSLKNHPGRGLDVNITLPLTYTSRIKLGLTLKVGGSVFLVPAENVRETFRARPEDINRVEGRAETVRRWERIYPVARLGELFGIDNGRREIWDSICVIVESRGESICVIVDEILGQRQIVYKELTTPTLAPSAFEGVSILDGRRMALILSVDGIIKQFKGQKASERKWM